MYVHTSIQGMYVYHYRVFSVRLLFGHKDYLDSCHLLEHSWLSFHHIQLMSTSVLSHIWGSYTFQKIQYLCQVVYYGYFLLQKCIIRVKLKEVEFFDI